MNQTAIGFVVLKHYKNTIWKSRTILLLLSLFSSSQLWSATLNPLPEPTPIHAIYCDSNKGIGTSPVKGTNFGTSTLGVTCNTTCTSTATWYDVPSGGNPLFDGDSDADGVFDTDLDGNSATFDPIAAGLVQANEAGVYTYYVECVCTDPMPCTSARIPVNLTILDCANPQGACTYLLVLEDTGADGWDGASIDVSVNLAPPNNYKLSTSDCDMALIPISANEGSFFDLTYWNGANESEHSWYVLDPLGNIATDINEIEANYGPNPPSNTDFRIKLECPEQCTETENYQLVVTLGAYPLTMAWEFTNAADDVIASGGTAENYMGLAPGTVIVEADFDLATCEDYIFRTLDGSGNGWAGGTWSFQSTDPNRGIPVLDEEGEATGFYEIVGGGGGFDFERINRFTIPCKPSDCPDELTLIANDIPNCQMTGFVHPAPPSHFVCFPNCGHATPAPTVLVSYPRAIPAQVLVPVGTAVDLPVGLNPVHFLITYSDGSIVRCNSSINILTSLNPVLTCESHVNISLQNPSLSIDDCTTVITPNLVLDNDVACEGEYIVTVSDEDGNEIGNAISADYVNQVLTYQIEQIGTNNTCWGTLTLEDKHAPIVACQNYLVSCNHPEALNQNYTYSEKYFADFDDLPAVIAGNSCLLYTSPSPRDS